VDFKKTYDLLIYYKFAEYILSIILLDFSIKAYKGCFVIKKIS